MMALKIELKPHEKIILGTALITNGDHRAQFFIDGNAPILRQKDILTQAEANSPAKLIYFCIQIMYTSGETEDQGSNYFNLVQQFLEAAPSAAPILEKVNNFLIAGSYYNALKETRRLIAFEKELIENVQGGGSLSIHSEIEPKPEGA
jgi:flagellar biosynthesis repressor protein FlbT